VIKVIILLRVRNLAIFALAVLSVSFIYIGYTGFGDSGPKLEQAIDKELEMELTEPAAGSIDITNPLEEVAPSIDNNSGDFFVEFRMQRDRARAARIELLKENANNPRSSQETVNKAQEALFVISQNIAAEAQTENLLKAKGYEEVAVFVEADNITVFVKKDNLNQIDITRIGDLVVRATGCKLEQVVITPKN